MNMNIIVAYKVTGQILIKKHVYLKWHYDKDKLHKIHSIYCVPIESSKNLALIADF